MGEYLNNLKIQFPNFEIWNIIKQIFFSADHVVYLQVHEWGKSHKKCHMGGRRELFVYYRSILHFFDTTMELLNITMELLDITIEFEEHITRFIPIARMITEEMKKIFI